MLNFDNTVNYAPTFKKINESIESINTLLTSLLLDTYTNQTFIYSDINVIRVNTSQNYDSIQSLSGGLPLKLDSSVSTNFFMKTNSVQFASQSTMSDKMNVSDFDSVSGNYFMKSNSTIFASTSTLSNKFDVSDSSQFALNSSVSAQLENKLDKTDFSIYSLDFASTSDLSSKLDASESTYFLPSSDFTIPTFSAEYLSDLSNFIETTMDDFGHKTSSMTFTNLMYNMIPTSFSGSVLEINNQPLLYNLSLTGNFSGTNNTIRNFSISSGSLSISNDFLQGTFNNNTIDAVNCTLNGIFSGNSFPNRSNYSIQISGDLYSNSIDCLNKLDLYISSRDYWNYGSNTFNSISSMNLMFPKVDYNFHRNTMKYIVSFNAYNGNIASCSFSNVYNNTLNGPDNIRLNTFSSGYNLFVSCPNIYNNSLSSISNLEMKASNSYYNTFDLNSIYNARTININSFKLKSNTFIYGNRVSLNNVVLSKNSFQNIDTLSIKLPDSDIHELQFSPVVDNTFSNVSKLVFDIESFSKTNTDGSNSFRANYAEFNIGSHVDNFNIGAFIGISQGKCSLAGLNINIPETAKNYSLTKEIINQLVWFTGNQSSGDYSEWSRNHLISFNSTNRWVNSGFNSILSSYCDVGILAEHSGTTEYDIQGSIFSTVIPMHDLYYSFIPPKFSPNYDSLKHYMILYSNSYRDYYEIDPHALEAGHNNNACENILLMKDYSFYSGLPFSYGNCTFIQWPSTRMSFIKSCFSNNTLLNTITELTSRMGQAIYTDIEYTVGKRVANAYESYKSYFSYRISSSQLSSLVNTSSSSQVYAGFSTSGIVNEAILWESLSR